MKFVPLLIVGVVILAVVWALAKKRFVAANVKVKIADIPSIFERLHATAKEGSFAVFMFTPPGEPSPDGAINLQFSVEGGRVGLDWVLIAPSNVRDQARFVQFAERLGYRVAEREMNQVKYLRIEEGGSLPRLCESTIRDLYSLSPDSDLDLIPEGFSWP